MLTYSNATHTKSQVSRCPVVQQRGVELLLAAFGLYPLRVVLDSLLQRRLVIPFGSLLILNIAVLTVVFGGIYTSQNTVRHHSERRLPAA